MTLFEQLKNIPKVDLHINLTGSISTDLAFSVTNESSIQEIEDKMIQRNAKDYLDSLKVPIEILRTKKNIILAVNDLIDRLEKNNVIYGELFLDLPLYNKRIDLEKVLNIILSVIDERKSNLQIVLCLSSEYSKEDNLNVISLLDKYYLKGVNGVYFQKDKMDSLNDFNYLFDRLSRDNIPYILNLDSKITNQDREIYYKAKRIIYSLDYLDENLLNDFKRNDIMLEIPISSLIESNIITSLKDYFVYELIKNNNLVTITSRDMTTLNTDILNEYCLLFNNCPISLHELIKMNTNILMNINISDKLKNELIVGFKEKSNMVL